ncbi:alpha/beta fold hydrolase [Iodobacter arcticus]|uniref:Alpha/beta fold hydrolase n=1 Tax=Iodobacter arcticus TaxID=590593 RepID=A0ABW2QSI9_9NEIS
MKTWVLLRGLMRESRHWGEFIPKLQAQYPNDRIITIDWPGNGVLHQEKSLSHIRDMVAHIRQTLAEQHINGPFYVLAISLGAMAAVAWANAFPHEIRACVLINTSLRPINPFYHRLRLQSIPALIGLLFNNVQGKEKIIIELTSTNKPQAALEQWIQFQKQFPISSSNILRQLTAAIRYRAHQPHVPLLLLSGAKDKLVSPACSQTLASKWQVPCRVHTQAGHDLPLDDGDWVLKQIEQYLSGLH